MLIEPKSSHMALVEQAIRSSGLYELLIVLRNSHISDAWLVSGAIYQTLWNHLTKRPEGYGIKDYDLIYFDNSDLSYNAEDKVIADLNAACAHLKLNVQTRNQARVHLWFPQHFGITYPQLRCALQSLLYYASTTHAIAARLNENDQLILKAPYGLSDAVEMVLRPNPILPNKITYEKKCARLVKLWPELKILPWPVAYQRKSEANTLTFRKV